MPLHAIRQTSKQAERLADKQAIEIPLRIKLQDPIADLSILQRSVFFAEAAMIGYLSPTECKSAAGKLGFTDCRYFDCHGSQAYLFSNEFDSVVVCRGAEPSKWSDITAEVDAHTVLSETVGKVHRGFKRKADELWPELETALEDTKQPLWFAGHSLGAALASICATRCLLSHIKSDPEELYTFGSPRVGDATYVNQVQLIHYRWVNANDPVPHIPPVWFGFRHSGEEMHIDGLGQLKTVQDAPKAGNRLQDSLKRLVQSRSGPLTNHSITEYVDAIYSIQRRQKPNAGLK